jgi:hypothetical protein
MTTAPDDDEQLVADLRAAVHHAGAPTEQMAAAAEAAYSWRTIDAELASLTEDSFLHGAVHAHAASAPARALVFEGSRLTVELTVSDDQLVGQLAPATAGTVTVSSPAGELAHTAIGADGRFAVSRPDHGPMRLRLSTQSGELITEWVHLPAR